MGDPYAETQVLPQSALSGIAIPTHRTIYQQQFTEPDSQPNRIALPSSTYPSSSTTRPIYGTMYSSDTSFPSVMYKPSESHQTRPILSSSSVAHQPVFYSSSYRPQQQMTSRRSMLISPTYRISEQQNQRLQGRQIIATTAQSSGVPYLVNSRSRGRRRSVHSNFAVGRKPSPPISMISSISFRVTQKPHLSARSVYFTDPSSSSFVIPGLSPMKELHFPEESELEFVSETPTLFENTNYWSQSVPTPSENEEMDYFQFFVVL